MRHDSTFKDVNMRLQTIQLLRDSWTLNYMWWFYYRCPRNLYLNSFKQIRKPTKNFHLLCFMFLFVLNTLSASVFFTIKLDNYKVNLYCERHTSYFVDNTLIYFRRYDLQHKKLEAVNVSHQISDSYVVLGLSAESNTNIYRVARIS